MDFNALAYPELVFIGSVEYKAKRNMSKGELSVPYSETPDVAIGDVISQKSGKREIYLKVIDVQFLEGGTQKVGTQHPNMLKLKVENTTAQEHMTKTVENHTYNIGSISSEQVQVGNNNTQTVTINMQQLVEKVASSDDLEAKSLLKKALENSTVGSLIGAGASALIGML